MTQPVLDGITPGQSETSTPKAATQPAHTLPSYVLLVDDEPSVRNFLNRCLTEWGYATKQAGSAAEALELVVAQAPSLILCDIRMPGEDGLWLAERLHTHWPLIPVVMTTAIDDIETVRQSAKVGAVDYITKPVTPDLLRQAVRRVTAAPLDATPASAGAAWSASAEPQVSGDPNDTKSEAEYRLEAPVKCPACGERIETLKAVRLIRAQVNFTSTLPRRGRLLACPHCMAIVPAELSNF
jgi:CheY-like chemotaxis protein